MERYCAHAATAAQTGVICLCRNACTLQVTIAKEDLTEMAVPMLVDAEFSADDAAAEAVVTSLWAKLHPSDKVAMSSEATGTAEPIVVSHDERREAVHRARLQLAQAASSSSLSNSSYRLHEEALEPETEPRSRPTRLPAAKKKVSNAAARQAAASAKAAARAEEWLHTAFADALPELPREEAQGWAICLQEALLETPVWPHTKEQWLTVLEQSVGDGVGPHACALIETNLRDSGWMTAAEPAEEPPVRTCTCTLICCSLRKYYRRYWRNQSAVVILFVKLRHECDAMGRWLQRARKAWLF